MDLMRRMTPEERLHRTFEFSRPVRNFAEAALRHKHPDASDREMLLMMALLAKLCWYR